MKGPLLTSSSSAEEDAPTPHAGAGRPPAAPGAGGAGAGGRLLRGSGGGGPAGVAAGGGRGGLPPGGRGGGARGAGSDAGGGGGHGGRRGGVGSAAEEGEGPAPPPPWNVSLLAEHLLSITCPPGSRALGHPPGGGGGAPPPGGAPPMSMSPPAPEDVAMEVVQKGDPKAGASILSRAAAILDRTPPIETHKFALLYARRGSCTGGVHRGAEADLLGGEYGSVGFAAFLQGLGELYPLRELQLYSGGLDAGPGAADGEFAAAWWGARQLALFHAPLLMPPGLNARKRHVGNDFVHIVYCEDEIYRTDAIGGQFGLVSVVVFPLGGVGAAGAAGGLGGEARVRVQTKPPPDPLLRAAAAAAVGQSAPTQGPAAAMGRFGGGGGGGGGGRGGGGEDEAAATAAAAAALKRLEFEQVVPLAAAAAFARQVAITTEVACRALLEDQIPGLSNLEDRLLQIQRMNKKRRRFAHQVPGGGVSLFAGVGSPPAVAVSKK